MENIEFLQDTSVVNTNNQQSESETNVEYDVHKQRNNQDITYINRVNRELIPVESRQDESDKKKHQSEVNVECYEENQQRTNSETGDQMLPESRRNESSLLQDFHTETVEENTINQNVDIKYTKQGTLRKRRKMNTSLNERKA